MAGWERQVLDFTSSLYLGMRHPSHSIRPWDRLSTGVPAFVETPQRNREVAGSIAMLQGCEDGVLSPSTLHLFWDLFGLLGRHPVVVFMDSGLYPIGRWGVERIKGLGKRVYVFRHFDPSSLYSVVKKGLGGREYPLIVTDGFCTGCGTPLPVGEYLSIARRFNGLLLIDDTQALGILGDSPDKTMPYGRGGGGILRWAGRRGREVLIISSLAKGFGVPVAVLSGTRRYIEDFKKRSKTRVHCSPPSTAVVHGAERALRINTIHGDSLRRKVLSLVGYFRALLMEMGLRPHGGFFPVQTLAFREGDVVRIHSELLSRGIKTVVLGGLRHPERIAFIITALHTRRDIERAVDGLRKVIPLHGSFSGRRTGQWKHTSTKYQ